MLAKKKKLKGDNSLCYYQKKMKKCDLGESE